MDNNEEYILKVLHRTNAGLQDSLIPAHGTKLKRLVEIFEGTASLTDEIRRLMTVQGFSKCALVMEWLLERTRRPEEEFSPEQFESDVLLLNEKIFEAFLNQPFDMPDFGKPPAATIAPPDLHQGFEISSDEFSSSGSASAGGTVMLQDDSVPVLSEPKWDSTAPTFSSFESATGQAAGENVPLPGSTPPLRDLVDSEMLDILNRIAASAREFSEKMPNERPIAASVLRVNARAGLEAARNSNNVVVEDFFGALVKLISAADERGKIKADLFSDIVHDVGDRLANAIQLPDNGVMLLKNITVFISDPKELLGKK